MPESQSMQTIPRMASNSRLPSINKSKNQKNQARFQHMMIQSHSQTSIGSANNI